MEYRDYYAVLGVPRTVSQAEIKKQFRKLARQHHPDVNTGDTAAERRFKEINEAHAVLGDPEKRKAYDELGANWEAYQRAAAGAGAGGQGAAGFGGFGGFGGAGTGQPGGYRFEYRGDPADLAGFSEFFRTFFGGSAAGPGTAPARGSSTRRGQTRTGSEELDGLDLDTLFGGLGTQGNRYQQRPLGQPQNLEADVSVTLEEAFHGTERLLDVGGRRLSVRIPRGVPHGRRIRLRGQAGTGPDAGDILLRVLVADHPVFSRTGDDLQRELPITLAEALLGAEVPVQTLTGRLMLRIPPETQTGRSFRLSGQGMPRSRDGERGDLYVKTRVVLPSGLDEEARSLVRKLTERIRQPDPRAPMQDR